MDDRFVFVVPPDTGVGGEVWSSFWFTGIAEAVPDGIEIVRVTANPHDLGFSPAANDFVVLTRWPLFRATYLNPIPMNRAILCEFGTRHGYSIGLWDMVDDSAYLHRAVGMVTCLTGSFADWHRAEYRIPESVPVIGTGLPIPSAHVDSLRPSVPIRPRSALFAQRIEDDTNPMLAVMIARSLIDDGYSVTFSSPDPISPKWPVGSWRRWGIDVKEGVRGDDYHALLRAHKVAISTGFQGSTWVAGYESWLVGGIPIAPGGTPPFCDPYALRYDPMDAARSISLSVSSARAIDHPSLVDESWFSGAMWWDRVMKGLHRG